MSDPQHNWRFLSESFDRELSDEEQNLLAHFTTEHESPREFMKLLEQIRECSVQQDSILESSSLLNQRLSDKKKLEIQRLLESEMEKQQVPLANRDVVLACQLVSQGAVELRELTGKIAEWDSDSKSLSEFLKKESLITDSGFLKIESNISDTIFLQTLDQTVLDEVAAAIKLRVPGDDCTILEDASDDYASGKFIKLLDRTNAGGSEAFEMLLGQLSDESRSVILQMRIYTNKVRLKAVVDEVKLRLIGRNILNRDQLRCYYSNVGIAIRRLFKSDPELHDSLLPSIGEQRIAVKDVVDSLNELADEEAIFVQMFTLRFFAGLTVQQIAILLDVTEHDVSVESSYGIALLLKLIEV